MDNDLNLTGVSEKQVMQQAIDTYGDLAQLDMVIEECAELGIELLTYTGENVPEIISEIVDVEIMLEQLEMIVKDIALKPSGAFELTKDIQRDMKQAAIELMKLQKIIQKGKRRGEFIKPEVTGQITNVLWTIGGIKEYFRKTIKSFPVDEKLRIERQYKLDRLYRRLESGGIK